LSLISIIDFSFFSIQSKAHSFSLDMNNTLAQQIHDVNSNLLVFVDIHMPWGSDAIWESSVHLITEPNMVLAPHFWHISSLKPGWPYQAKYFPYDGYNYWSYYAAGDYALGRQNLHLFLDSYHKKVVDMYGLPCVFTEFGGSRWMVQPMVDFMEWCRINGYGYSYWGFYAPTTADPSKETYGYGLLEPSWTNPSPCGTAFINSLSYEPPIPEPEPEPEPPPPEPEPEPEPEPLVTKSSMVGFLAAVGAALMLLGAAVQGYKEELEE